MTFSALSGVCGLCIKQFHCICLCTNADEKKTLNSNQLGLLFKELFVYKNMWKTGYKVCLSIVINSKWGFSRQRNAQVNKYCMTNTVVISLFCCCSFISYRRRRLYVFLSSADTVALYNMDYVTIMTSLTTVSYSRALMENALLLC